MCVHGTDDVQHDVPRVGMRAAVSCKASRICMCMLTAMEQLSCFQDTCAPYRKRMLMLANTSRHIVFEACSCQVCVLSAML
jgi:hypothetical protein